MTGARSQWDIIKSRIVPHVVLDFYESDQWADYGERAYVASVQLCWLGLYFSFCIEIARPARGIEAP